MMITGQRNRRESRLSGMGRILARPHEIEGDAPVGDSRLQLDGRRDGLMYVPKGYSRHHPAPLALMLHGAGGNALHGLDLLRPLAEQAGMILVAPDSRGRTWDVILGGYGPDVDYINAALDKVFGLCAVDPDMIAVGGFSDGASYALSLGLTNGDLFSHVIAFSPGFMAPGGQEGMPRFYISHGTEDRTLPIDRCSRQIVPQLERAGYDVTYHEFQGPHTVPPFIAHESVEWFLAGPEEVE